jgi:fatty acid amide hydrolase 2
MAPEHAMAGRIAVCEVPGLSPLALRMDPLLLLSATELARRIRARDVSAHDVVLAHVRRIQKVDPVLHAVVQDRFALALDEAGRADDLLAGGATRDLPPLFGVPCTVKEAFALEGMPNTGGLVARRGRPATADATAVKRLRAAGAIPLGVTNLSELCMWMESSNRIYGRTNNAYDPTRTAGGSSGGEGAIVGAAGAPFGLGSDVGGSIRMPAFFNGVFGHKASGGLVPNSGQFPCAENDALRYLTTGPLCRRAEDLMPLLRVLAGPDGIDARCEAMPLGDPASVKLAGMRVVVVRHNGIVRIEPALEDAIERAASALARRGALVVEARLDKLSRSLEMWSAVLNAAGGETFAELMGEGTPIRAGAELARWLLGRSSHTFPAIMLALLEKVPSLMPGHAEAMVPDDRAPPRRPEPHRAGRGDALPPVPEGGAEAQPPAPRPARLRLHGDLQRAREPGDAGAARPVPRPAVAPPRRAGRRRPRRGPRDDRRRPGARGALRRVGPSPPAHRGLSSARSEDPAPERVDPVPERPEARRTVRAVGGGRGRLFHVVVAQLRQGGRGRRPRPGGAG